MSARTRSILLLFVGLFVGGLVPALGQITNQVVNSIIATTCTNQFVRVIAATGAATCATVALGSDVSGTLPAGSLPTPKIVTVTRDLTVASGNVAYTGCGFSPRLLIATGAVNGATTAYTTFSGMTASGGGQGSTSIFGTSYTQSTNFLQAIDATGANSQIANIVTFDADGFTLAWTKTGTPTGSFVVYV